MSKAMGHLAIFISAMLIASLACAEPLGRLFFSPEQRAMLDLARDRAPMTKGTGAVQPVAPSEVTLNGLVTRSDGKGSLWVNGKLEQGISYQGTPERNQVRIKSPSGGVKLKVGQTYDPANDRVQENYHHLPPAPPAQANKPAATKPAPPTPATNPRDDILDPDTPAAQ